MQHTWSKFLVGVTAAALLTAACSPAAAPSAPSGGGAAQPAAPSQPAAAPAAAPAVGENAIDKVTLDKSKPTEVVFWHRQTGPSEAVQNKLIEEFNKTNEWGITVKAESLGDYNKLYQKILGAIQAKSPPDLAAAYETMSAEYYDAKAIVPFDEYMASKKYGLSDADLKDLVPAYIEASKFNQYGGKFLTFPYTKSALMLYTNTEVMKSLGISKPAATWDEFLAHCRKAVAAIGKCYAMEVSASTADAIVYSYGGDVISKEGKVAFDSAGALQALKLYETLTTEKLAHQIKGNDDQSDIAAGRALYMIRSSTSIPFLLAQMKEAGKFATANLPQGQAGKDAKTVLFGANVSIFKTTPEKQLASWQFIKWLASKDVTARWTLDSSNGYFPLRLSAINEASTKKYFEENPHFAAAFEASKSGKVEPSNKGWQEVRKFIEDGVTGVVTGKMTAADAQKQIMDKSKKALSE